MRRDAEFAKASKFSLALPSGIKAMFLEEGAGLSSQGMQNLKTLTNADLDYEKVKSSLLKMDITAEKMTPGVGLKDGGKALLVDGDGTAVVDEGIFAADETDSDCSSLNSECEVAILAELEELDLTEDEGSKAIVALIDAIHECGA